MFSTERETSCTTQIGNLNVDAINYLLGSDDTL